MLASFISYRSNYAFAVRLIDLRPDIWKRLDNFSRPLDEDMNVDLLTTLCKFGLLDEDRRLEFVEEVRAAAVEDADDSFLSDEGIANTLTISERESILADVETEVLGKLSEHVHRLRGEWDRDYEPDSYFDPLRESVNRFAGAMGGRVDPKLIKNATESHIRSAVWSMEDDYVPDSKSTAPVQQSAAKADSLDELFRDVDE